MQPSTSRHEEKCTIPSEKPRPQVHLQLAKRPQRKIEDSTRARYPHFYVEANYFRVNVPKCELNVFIYNLSFIRKMRGQQIKIKNRELMSTLYWEIVMGNRDVFPDENYMVYNDCDTVWSLKKLRIPHVCSTLKYTTVTMNISFTKAWTIPLHDYDSMEESDRMQFANFLDSLLTMRVRCKLRNESNNFYSRRNSLFYVPNHFEYENPESKNLMMRLSCVLDIWTGLYGAIKFCEGGLFYNVDVHHSVFYHPEMPLIQAMVEILLGHEVKYDDIKEALSNDNAIRPSHLKELEHALKDVRVEIHFGGSRSIMTKKFCSMGTRSAEVHKFKEGNEVISVHNFFLRKYDVRLQYPWLPCVELGKKGSFYPLECCFVSSTRKQRFTGILSDRLRAEMIRRTAIPPQAKRKILSTMSQSPQNEPSNHLNPSDEWQHTYNFSLQREFVKVKASLVPAPKLLFGCQETQNDLEAFYDKENVGTWDMGVKGGNTRRMRNTGKRLVCGLVCVTNDVYLKQTADNPEARTLDLEHFTALMVMLESFGFSVWKKDVPYMNETFNIKGKDAGHKLVQYMKAFKADVNKKFPEATPLCIFVFPSIPNRVIPNIAIGEFDQHRLVKYVCDVMVEVPSQSMIRQTYLRLKKSPTCATASNVAMKIVGKVGEVLYQIESGGEHQNWTVLSNPNEPTLLLGIDVSHPVTSEKKAGGIYSKSIGSIVSNIDVECAQYKAHVRLLEHSDNVMGMRTEVKAALQLFVEKTRKKPKHIVVYRDGVSESQFYDVLDNEKKMIENALIECNIDATLTYIVLTKRHHTKFFALDKNYTCGEEGNLKPGTLVESTVTTDKYYDFFLQSHQGIRGTSKSVHYYVLWDSWAPTDYFWKTITYALCYNYIRCSKSVSQPAPSYYAHLAAKKAKQHLGVFHEFFYNPERYRNDYEREAAYNEAIQTNIDGMYFV